MTRKELIALAIGIVVGVLLTVAVQGLLRWLNVDSCLDSGGAWDYQFETCVGVRAAD